MLLYFGLPSCALFACFFCALLALIQRASAKLSIISPTARLQVVGRVTSVLLFGSSRARVFGDLVKIRHWSCSLPFCLSAGERRQSVNCWLQFSSGVAATSLSTLPSEDRITDRLSGFSTHSFLHTVARWLLQSFSVLGEDERRNKKRDRRCFETRLELSSCYQYQFNLRSRVKEKMTLR